jgi:type IX secretion system PorP/SprF family membrane protein
MSAIKKILLILFLAFTLKVSEGQQTPLNPVSYRIFSPFIFNPAITGSKDFLSADLIAGSTGKNKSQIISGNTRLSKKGQDYFSSPAATKFTNIGLGGYLFNDLNGLSRNTGAGLSGSYHVQLDKQALSFLSFGASAKAVYNRYSGNPDLSDSAKNTFFPNFDAGIYYYSPSFYAGFSSTNILGNPEETDSLSISVIPVSRQLFFQAGYRFVLNRSLNILLEPSVIINTDDSFSEKLSEMIQPALKLYAGDFCVGTYFSDFNKMSFFLQFKYPKFYLGTYFALPNDSPFYKKSITAEFAIGINFSGFKTGFPGVNHW